MNALHNPIADLSSLQFLAFYGTLCALVVIGGGFLVRWTDAISSEGLEPLPRSLDPYEIAYLRGDLNELVRFIVFDLVRSGALELRPRKGKKPPVFCRTPAVPSPETLSAPARATYDFFEEPHTTEELFASGVPEKIAGLYASDRAMLVQRKLFTTPETRSAMRHARVYGSLIIVGLGGYRLWYAHQLHHRNVGFLVAIGLGSLVLLFLFTAIPRLSQRGRRYLRTLRAGLPASAQSSSSPDTFPLIVAAGGMGVLAGTPYADVSTTFRHQAAAASTSSSASCGSSSCSSSSGGGGGCSGGCGGGCGG